jgi:hypothetical protein
MLKSPPSTAIVRARRHNPVSLRPRTPLPTKAAAFDIVHQSEIIGRGLGLFVLYTATLNYMHYRRIRKAVEQAKDEQKNDKNKK